MLVAICGQNDVECPPLHVGAECGVVVSNTIDVIGESVMSSENSQYGLNVCLSSNRPAIFDRCKTGELVGSGLI